MMKHQSNSLQKVVKYGGYILILCFYSYLSLWQSDGPPPHHHHIKPTHRKCFQTVGSPTASILEKQNRNHMAEGVRQPEECWQASLKEHQWVL